MGGESYYTCRAAVLLGCSVHIADRDERVASRHGGSNAVCQVRDDQQRAAVYSRTETRSVMDRCAIHYHSVMDQYEQ